MNKILRYIALVGVFIIPFIPLFVANSLFFPFITGKNFMFRVIVEIVFAAWVILAATDKAYRPKWNVLLYSLVGFVGIMAIANIFSVNPFKSFWSNYERMEGWVTLAHLAAYFIVLGTVLAKEKLWDAFFQTNLGVNLIVSLFSIMQISGLLTINQGGVRADATFGNATYLAIYTVFSIFISALFLLRSRANLHVYRNGYLFLGFNVGFFFFIMPYLSNSLANVPSSPAYKWAFLGFLIINLLCFFTTYFKREHILYAAIVAVNLFTLYHTATRGAILGLLGGVFVAGVLIAIFERNNKIMRNTALGMILAAVVVVLTFFAIRQTAFVQNSPVLSRFAQISVTEKTTLSRFKLWNMAFEGFQERPVLGWGQESFNYVFNKYYNPELYNQEQWFDRTHNVIFDWLIAGGVFGLLAYLAFFVAILYSIWKSRGEEAFSISEKALLTGLLVAYFIHNIFVFDNLTSYLMYIAIAAYVYNRTSLRPAPASHRVENSVVAPVVAAAFLVVMYMVNLNAYLANKSLIAAISSSPVQNSIALNATKFKDALSYGTFGSPEIREQLLSLGSQVLRSELGGRDELLALAIEEGKRQTEITPRDARYFVFYGTFLAQTGDVKGAIPYLQKAVEFSPKKQSILFALAGSYMAAQDYQNAHLVLKTAYEAEPTYMQARMVYAASAIYIKDFALADSILAGLDTATISGNNDILQAYYTTQQYTKIIDIWKQRVADAPTSQNFSSLAAAYLYANDKKSAIAQIQEAIKRDPSFKTQGDEYIKQIQSGKQL